MIYSLYNEMRQTINYKGQLSVGDIVSYTSSSNACDYKVIELKKNIGMIKNTRNKNVYYCIRYIKGTGWVEVTT